MNKVSFQSVDNLLQSLIINVKLCSKQAQFWSNDSFGGFPDLGELPDSAVYNVVTSSTFDSYLYPSFTMDIMNVAAVKASAGAATELMIWKMVQSEEYSQAAHTTSMAIAEAKHICAIYEKEYTKLYP